MFSDMNRLARAVLITTLALVVVLVLGSLAGNFYLGVRLSDAQTERVETQSALDGVREEYNKLYEEYTSDTGSRPAAASPEQVDNAVPKTVTGSAGAQGATGAQGPRGLMGERGQEGPQGPQGEPGKDGAQGAPGAAGGNGSRGEAGASGATGATGEAGKDGSAGKDGATGAVGPAGPQGPPGATGAAGSNGIDGRGVMSLTCNTDATWTVLFTDGTSQVTPGPCRVLLPVE